MPLSKSTFQVRQNADNAGIPLVEQEVTAATSYSLLYEGTAYSGFPVNRVYLGRSYQTLIMTRNARWDAAASLWYADNGSTTGYAQRWDIGFGYQHPQGAGLYTIKDTSAGSWADSAWTGTASSYTIIGQDNDYNGLPMIRMRETGYLPSSTYASLAVNALYPEFIPKAWGRVDLVGGGGTGNWTVANRNLAGLATISRVNATTANVLTMNYLASNYDGVIICNALYAGGASAGLTVSPQLQGNGDWDLEFYQTQSHAYIDLDSSGLTVELYVVVFGRQES